MEAINKKTIIDRLGCYCKNNQFSTRILRMIFTKSALAISV